MGFFDWIKDATLDVVSAAIPGNVDDVIIDRYLRSEPRSNSGALVGDGALVQRGTARMDNPLVPDFIEELYAPERFAPTPQQVNGAVSVQGCPIYVQPRVEQRLRAPRGYVIVTDPNTGQKTAMLKAAARSCGFWKAPTKPMFTGSEIKTLRKASSLNKKGDRLAKILNSCASQSPLRRMRGKR